MLVWLFLCDGALHWFGGLLGLRTGQFCVLTAAESGGSPGGLGCCPFWGGGSVVVNLLFNVPPIVCGVFVFVFVLLCIALCMFWFCNHHEGGGLVALLLLSCGCIVAVGVLWLFLAELWVGLQCVIVVFPGHTHFFSVVPLESYGYALLM